MVVTVDAPKIEFMDGYIYWTHQHQKGSFDIALPTPYVDLYDSSGRSIYYQDNPQRASAFLRVLLNPAASPADTRPARRPSLEEAVNMFSELRQYEQQAFGKPRHTVFALSNLDKASVGKPQDDAVAELKKHASDLNIRVIEVRIHKS
jgi:hypothetical protein